VRWPKKREFVAFCLLSLAYGGEVKPVEELAEAVRRRLGYNAKTSKNIVRRLANLGYLEKVKKGSVRVRTLEEVVYELLVYFAVSRAQRARKSYSS